MWKCDKCKKPKSIEKGEGWILVGCEHIAILTWEKENEDNGHLR